MWPPPLRWGFAPTHYQAAEPRATASLHTGCVSKQPWGTRAGLRAGPRPPRPEEQDKRIWKIK
eukprot:6489799-Lingulodinium_polyedra.AAC.1